MPGGNYIFPQKPPFSGGSIDNLIVSGSAVFNTISSSILSANTYYSAGTPLSSIFVLVGASGFSPTLVQPGSNIITGGTSTNPIISVSSSPSFLNVSGSGTSTWNALTATTISASTFYSGNTNLTNIFQGLNTSILGITPGSNILTSGTQTEIVVSMIASPSFLNETGSGTSTWHALTATTISASTFYSGNTSLTNIFQALNTSILGITPGSNIITGGTQTETTISVTASPFFNNISSSGTSLANSFSATTFSASSISSGTTNLINIFQQIGPYVLTSSTEFVSTATTAYILSSTSIVNSVDAIGNLFTGGTTANPIVEMVSSPSFFNTTVSGIGVFNTFSATTISGNTFYSAGTSLQQIIYSIATGATGIGGVVSVEAIGNLFTGGTAAVPVIEISASPSFFNETGSGTSVWNSFSSTTISGNTFYSAGTPLQQIILSIVTGNTGGGSGTVTGVEPGSNIITGGTASNPSISVSSSPFFNNLNSSGTSLSNSFSATSLSAGTIISGTTNLTGIFQQLNTSILGITPGSNVLTSGTQTETVISIVASPTFFNETGSGTSTWHAITATTISAATFYSAGTSLTNIFQGLGTSILGITPGSNIITGGTQTNPIVSVSASPSFLNETGSGTSTWHAFSATSIVATTISATTISATTFSATTIISGATNIWNIFSGGTLWTVGLGANSIIQNNGSGHAAAGQNAFSVGASNTANALNSLNIGGSGGTIDASSTSASILGGNGNIISGSTNAVILGGTGNTINSGSSFSTIINGFRNIISGATNSGIFGAQNSYITGLTNVVILATTGITATTSNTTYVQNLNSVGGGIISSGGTNLTSIFTTPSQVGVLGIGPGSNITTGGTASNIFISTVASPSFFNETGSGTSLWNAFSATTLSATTATIGTLTNGVSATTQAAGDSSLRVATDAFVTLAIANAIAGVNPAVAVQAATTLSATTSGYTYLNGVSGVGATLTGPVNTAFVVDGFTFTTVGQRVLVKNDGQNPVGAYNGIYFVTQLQTGILPVVLTRALDYDQPSDINNTGSIPVINGTVNGNTSWILTSTVNTVGTDPLTYVQFSIAPSNIITNTTPAGGNLTGTYPNPTIISSVALTGIPTTPTPTAGNNSTQIANTTFVISQIAASTGSTGGGGSTTSVQPGSNITTGGTQSNPFISVVASPSFLNQTGSGTSTWNIITATTVSASTAYTISLLVNANILNPANPERLLVSDGGLGNTSSGYSNVIVARANVNNYAQTNIINLFSGTNSSADVIATADNGNENINYVDFGINSSVFSGFLGNANDGYMYSAGNNMWIGNTTPGKNIYIITDGGLSSNTRITINSGGTTFSIPVSATTLSATNLTVSATTIMYGLTDYLSGTTRMMQVSSGGTVTATTQVITAFGVPLTAQTALSTLGNWDPYGNYTATTTSIIANTYQGQEYYDSLYYYIAIADNVFIRTNRGYVNYNVQTLVDGPIISWNVLSGINATVTLGGNRTLNMFNTTSGNTYTLEVHQPASGSTVGYTISLSAVTNSKVVGAGSGTPIYSTASGATDILTVYYNGTNYYWDYGNSYS